MPTYRRPWVELPRVVECVLAAVVAAVMWWLLSVVMGESARHALVGTMFMGMLFFAIFLFSSRKPGRSGS